MARHVKPTVKFLIIALVAIGLIFAYTTMKKSGAIDKLAKVVAPEGKVEVVQTTPEAKKAVKEGTPKVVIGINTWGGYAPGIYYNNGFAGSTNSRFFKEQGIIVEFKLFEDPGPMRQAWKSKEIDIIGLATADALPAEINELMDMNPVAFIQIDDSRGGDVVVADATIKRAKDLEGKKVALLPLSPSHTLLLVWCEADGADVSKIQIIPTKDGIEPGTLFKTGEVSAAIVWAPTDDECIKNRPGSHRVFSTKQARKAVSDVLIISESYIQKNRDIVTKFVIGWLVAVAEINTDKNAKLLAAEIMSKSPFKVSIEDATDMIDNTRLSSYGDNLQFFGIQPGGITGDEMYTKMFRLYKKAGVITKNVPSWRQISNSSIVSSLKLSGKGYEPEGGVIFSTATEIETKAPAFAVKPAPVKFAFNSSELTDEGKIAIESYFGPIAREFGGSRVRVEGNTDNVGGKEYNIKLSFNRAYTVSAYLVKKYNFDPKRFIIEGLGFSNPVPGCESNSTEECRAKNRRTEFVLLNPNIK